MADTESPSVDLELAGIRISSDSVAMFDGHVCKKRLPKPEVHEITLCHGFLAAHPIMLALFGLPLFVLGAIVAAAIATGGDIEAEHFLILGFLPLGSYCILWAFKRGRYLLVRVRDGSHRLLFSGKPTPEEMEAFLRDAERRHGYVVVMHAPDGTSADDAVRPGQREPQDPAKLVAKWTTFALVGTILAGGVVFMWSHWHSSRRAAEAERLVQIAYAAYEAGNHDVAIDRCTCAIGLDPRQAHAYIGRGLSYLAKGDVERAARDLNRAIEIGSAPFSGYTARGDLYARTGRLALAIQDYTRAIGFDPDAAAVYAGRAVAYARHGEIALALQDHDKAVRLMPENPEFYFLRAQTYAKRNDLDRGIQDCTKAIAIAPKYVPAHVWRGYLYGRKAERALAVADYVEACKLAPDDAAAHNGLGWAYYKSGDYRAAIRACTKSLELDPECANTYHSRACAYRDSGKLDEALRDFDRAVQLDPQHGYSHIDRGVLYAMRGQHDKAIEGLAKGIELGIDDKRDLADAYGRRAVSHFHKKQYDKAWADVRACQKLGGSVDEDSLKRLREASGKRE